MIYHICIAGIHMYIKAPKKVKINKKLKLFNRYDKVKEPQLHITLQNEESIPIPEDTLLVDEHLHWKSSGKKEEEILIFLKDKDKKEANNCLIANKNWDSVSIVTKGYVSCMISPLLGPLGEILFRNCILYHEGIVIHGVAVKWRNKGILLSAPSGTGKTTQANLWVKHKGAKIINGDRPAIRVEESKVQVYGTLWNGSSPRCVNSAADLKLIVLLEQSPTNQIIRLNNKEAVSKIMPRCFLPYFNKDSMNIALENLERIIEMIPVYLLKCRPDMEAVELVSQCIE